MKMNGEGMETGLKLVLLLVGVDVSEEEVGSGNGSNCLNSAQGDGSKTEVRHPERREGWATVLASKSPWMAEMVGSVER